MVGGNIDEVPNGGVPQPPEDEHSGPVGERQPDEGAPRGGPTPREPSARQGEGPEVEGTRAGGGVVKLPAEQFTAMMGVLLAAVGGAKAREVPFSAIPPRGNREEENNVGGERASGAGGGGDPSNNRRGPRADRTRDASERLNQEGRQAGE